MDRRSFIGASGALALAGTPVVYGEGEWEITAESAKSVERGLDWLARNQGTSGNWQSPDLGLSPLGH